LKIPPWFLLCPLIAAGAELPRSTADLILDGDLSDAFWRDAAQAGGGVRAGVRGSYLCWSADIAEPGGRVVARSQGRSPVWERDAVESPAVEDRLVLHLKYRGASGAERHIRVGVNPWGAYRVEEGSVILPSIRVLRAARVSPGGWRVEAALNLESVDAARDGSFSLSLERIRARRPLAPETRLTSPEFTARGPFVASSAPAERMPAIGITDSPLEAGRVPRVPPVVAQWDHPAWANVPDFILPRNEPEPRASRYPARVKWMHDGRTLALLFQVEEPEPVVARNGGRDSNVTADDHVAVYLATSGSAFLEIAVNTVGAIRDSRGGGPHHQRPSTGWDAAIQTQTDIRYGHWIARIDIPLDECAAALGEVGVPSDWRVLLKRYRAARPGEPAETHALPVIGGANTFYGPIRYRRLRLGESSPASTAVRRTSTVDAVDAFVWSPLERRYRGVRTMVDRYLRRRVLESVHAERRAWDKVETRADWEHFRDQRMKGFRESLGEFPPARPPLAASVTATHKGDGYRLENTIFQVRPGYWMTANLYLPARVSGRVPAILIVHSQHYPKTQGELHDMGELWARAGAAVLIMERPGYGERVENTAWFRSAYASRHTFTKQLFLAGESYSAWAAWDVIRSVDFLAARPDIDAERIVVLGAVAGGGEPAAVAAALDPRIAAVAPFNYDQGHVRVHGDSPGQTAKQFLPWLVAASVAPRKFIRAFEFGWEGAEEADYPEVWVDGMARSRKVWGFYNALGSLAGSQAYGLIRLSMERVSHCFSIGPQQRLELYPLLDRWFGIPVPAAQDLAILPDSQLSTNPEREESRRQEAKRRRPHADLLSLPPDVSAKLQRRKLHEIAHEMGERQLLAARARLDSTPAGERLASLRKRLAEVLGDIEPASSPRAELVWKRGDTEALSITVEEGIEVPMLLIRPRRTGPVPVVVAVAQGGKERFLSNRGKEVTALIEAGAAVCLADLRGTGETSPTSEDADSGALSRLASLEFDLARSLVGSRLKDLRTVVAYLRARSDVDRKGIALWGESFAPVNPANLFVDEIDFEIGPQIQFRSDPTGAHVALLGALYEPDVRAVAGRGGLASYLSPLTDAFTYTPMDSVLLGVLKVTDVSDIVAAIAPRAVSWEAAVDGRNIAVTPEALARYFLPASTAFAKAGAANKLRIAAERSSVAEWLLGELKR
jgi:dienelactone hydrolase